MCKTVPWSETIKSRRIRFLGHLLRLDSRTPARKALTEYLRPVLRDPGHPPLTWWSVVLNDMRGLGMPTGLLELERIASDRGRWRQLSRAVS